MSKSDEKSSKPRQMVHVAQSECADWIYQLERARQDVPGAPTVARASKELHSAVMLYWTQIRRFSDQPAVQSKWHDEEIRAANDSFTLADLASLRLQQTARTETYWNADTGREEERQVAEAWTMPPEMSLAVHDQLDRCAKSLGFDASVEAETIYPEPV